MKEFREKEKSLMVSDCTLEAIFSLCLHLSPCCFSFAASQGSLRAQTLPEEALAASPLFTVTVKRVDAASPPLHLKGIDHPITTDKPRCILIRAQHVSFRTTGGRILNNDQLSGSEGHSVLVTAPILVVSEIHL